MEEEKTYFLDDPKNKELACAAITNTYTLSTLQRKVLCLIIRISLRHRVTTTRLALNSALNRPRRDTNTRNILKQLMSCGYITLTQQNRAYNIQINSDELHQPIHTYKMLTKK